jgi:hypothetical protein
MSNAAGYNQRRDLPTLHVVKLWCAPYCSRSSMEWLGKTILLSILHGCVSRCMLLTGEQATKTKHRKRQRILLPADGAHCYVDNWDDSMDVLASGCSKMNQLNDASLMFSQRETRNDRSASERYFWGYCPLK